MPDTQVPVPLVLSSLYARLNTIEPLCRVIIADAKISALLTFRGEQEQRVLLDYSGSPARISINNGATEAHIYVTINADVMHDVLSGKITPGVAIARREMLLRGSPGHLARFIPMLDFGGLLYQEHLADIGYDGYCRKSGPSPVKEAVLSEKIFRGDPIPLVKMNPLEKLFAKVVNGAAYAMGYMMGFLRYRVMKKLSIFDALGAMSSGLEAATPEMKEKP